MRAIVHAAIVVGIVTTEMSARAHEPVANWFDDPFFAIASDDPACPPPAGPFVTRAERSEQTHRRAEKGTTCWLAHACDRPNAYAYDRDIAQGIRDALVHVEPLIGAALWITVQGRIVYLEGCARNAATAARIEAVVRDVAYVQQVVPIVRLDANAPPPYRVLQYGDR